MRTTKTCLSDVRRRIAPRLAPADAYETIKARVSVADALAAFAGVTPDRHGFCRCPLHAEDTASFKIYPDGRSFYCFGCHKGGDVINFTRDFLGVGPWEAVQALDAQFGLGLASGHSDPARVAAAQEAARTRREEEKQQEAELQAASDAVRNARKALDALPKPRTPEEGGAYGAAMGRMEEGEFLFQQQLNQNRNR